MYMYIRVTARLRMLGSALNNVLIAWVSCQYGETLHSCAVHVFSLAFGSGKYFAHSYNSVYHSQVTHV